MATALSIAAAVLVLGLLLFLIARRPTPQLPEPRKRSPEKPSATAPTQSAAADTPKEAAPSDGLGSAAPTSPAVVEARTQDVGVAQTPVTAARPSRAMDPQLAETAHEQDVAAIRQGLATTRNGFVARLAKLFGAKKEIDKGVLEEIEEVLISADIGVRTTERMLEELRDKMQRGELKDDQSVWNSLRAQAETILKIEAGPLKLEAKPAVILMIGVNGAGKTTTIGKLASKYVAQGKKVLLAAGDTYRAAAVLQLEMWGKRVGCTVVKGKEGADPGAVIFEALKRAKEESYDLVIADTAGRLHTRVPLMEELKKLERTVTKANDGRGPDEVFLVLDATTGQNAVQQMKLFRDALSITGVVLTKLDGTAKGGVVLGVVEQHRIPVRFIGLGERVEDLREFEARTFVEALFAKPAEATMAA